MYISTFKNYIDQHKSNVLEWRFENFKFWFNKLPFLIEKLFELYGGKLKLVDVEIVDVVDECPVGFSPLNLKKLIIKTRTDDKQFENEIYLPIPNKYDMFEVNSNPYIMRMEFADKPLCVYNDTDTNNPLNAKIRIKSIVISDRFGALKYAIPLIGLLVVLGDVSIDDIHITTEPVENYIKSTRKKNLYLNWLKFSNKPFDKLILASLSKFLPEEVNSYKARLEKFFNTFTFGTYFRYLINDFESTELEIFIKLFKQGIEIFNNGGYKNKFYTTSQKRIKYWDLIVEYLLTRLEIGLVNYRNMKVINKVKFDKEMLLKWLVSGNTMFQYVQGMENPFREINMKETIVIAIKNELPLHYLSLDMSFLDKIDPINTPDNEKLGKVQRLSKTVELDEFGNFV